ncbi:Nif-regulating protein A [uncultured archaeon]|nr:Nif-regulating protein A [uncultured archaeon]
METIETPCPSCSPQTPVSHSVLKSEKGALLQCEDCGAVHKEATPRKVLVRVVVSKGDKSLRMGTLLSGFVRVGDELIVDDETTGEAYHVRISSIEVGDKRLDSASAEDIKTIWARAIDEVVVKIAISRRETTESIEMKVPGDAEYVIGDKVKAGNRELKIVRIKIRDGGFKSRKGIAVAAKDIRRIYADSGIREPGRISRGGERIRIKKRESVWSLKHKKTD